LRKAVENLRMREDISPDELASEAGRLACIERINLGECSLYGKDHFRQETYADR
jgi:hypothetical protein